MADPHKNFAYSTVSGTSAAGDNNPPGTGTALAVQSGDGNAKFPAAPFNCTVWPGTGQPTSANAEIVRVTSKGTGDNWTIQRQQEGSASGGAINIAVNYQIAASITAKTLTDIEADYMGSWAPAIAVSAGTGLQTLAGQTSISQTGSLFVFPVTLPFPIKFNQVLMIHSLQTVSSATTESVSNTYYSNFGIYSMTSNSMSLISSNSFSIAESISQNSNTAVSLNWNFPTSTATSGYAYGSLGGTGLTSPAQIGSFITGARIVGMQFGGEMSLNAGLYWIGLNSYRSTGGAHSTYGLSHAGVIGQNINPINMAGTVSGPMPIGMAAAEFFQSAARISGWNGRFIMGFATNTLQNGFYGTRLPNQLELINMQTLNTAGSILPLVSFVST